MFGLTSHNAEIVDREKRGGNKVSVTIVATAYRQRAARRAARLKAKTLVPIRHQDIEFIQKRKNPKMVPDRFTFRVSWE